MLLLVSLVVLIRNKSSDDIYFIEGSSENFGIEDIEKLTEYSLPDNIIIVALRLYYKKGILQAGYLHLRVPIDSIHEVTNNFQEEKILRAIPRSMNNLLEWSGLNGDNLQIYAIYEENYLSRKYTSVNHGDSVLITEPVNGYYDIYIGKHISDERPTTKPWGKGEKKPVEGLIK